VRGPHASSALQLDPAPFERSQLVDAFAARTNPDSDLQSLQKCDQCLLVFGGKIESERMALHRVCLRAVGLIAGGNIGVACAARAFSASGRERSTKSAATTATHVRAQRWAVEMERAGARSFWPCPPLRLYTLTQAAPSELGGKCSVEE
jgi:hypothetical protein